MEHNSNGEGEIITQVICCTPALGLLICTLLVRFLAQGLYKSTPYLDHFYHNLSKANNAGRPPVRKKMTGSSRSNCLRSTKSNRPANALSV